MRLLSPLGRPSAASRNAVHVIRRSEHQRTLLSALALLVDVELEWWLMVAGGTSQEGIWSNIRGGRKFESSEITCHSCVRNGVYLLGFPSLSIASVSSFLSFVDLPMIVT